MPDLFPSLTALILAALVMAAGQLIYATVGFGAGMFSIALLALILPDLAGSVATLFLLTLVTEIWILIHAWRHAHARLLLGLVPTMALGMWLGTHLLATADVSGLKRALGAFVIAAGIWFLYQLRRKPPTQPPPAESPPRRALTWTSIPAGLISGLLGGVFGTGGPPVIIYLRAYGLDKSAFRATIIWFFFLMSLIRTVTYTQAGILTPQILWAAACLLPASAVGMLLGMAFHRRLSESLFAFIVPCLLIVLGGLLLAGGGR